jgi:hypothetical protein
MAQVDSENSTETKLSAAKDEGLFIFATTHLDDMLQAALLRHGLPTMKRRRRSIKKRNRQRLTAHAGRLRR